MAVFCRTKSGDWLKKCSFCLGLRRLTLRYNSRVSQSLIKRFTTKVAIGCLGVCVLVCLILYGLYADVDHAGLIPHSRKAVVTFPSRDWEIGEYLACSAVHGDRIADVLLDCSGDGSHASREMDATFWGKVRMQPVTFTCQRTPSRIICHLPK